MKALAIKHTGLLQGVILLAELNLSGGSLCIHTANSQKHSQVEQIRRDLTTSHENSKNGALAHSPDSSNCHIDEFSIVCQTWNIQWHAHIMLPRFLLLHRHNVH